MGELMTAINIADALAAEIAAHQFGDAPTPPGRLLQAFQAATSPKRWMDQYGVYGCTCVAKSLPLLEVVFLIHGDVSSGIDVYQGCYHPGVGASAGSHDKGGCVDLGQFQDRHLARARARGWCDQHRTTAQGFSGDHNHGWPNGCPHGSPLQKLQQREWNNGRNGLVSELRITGPGPIGTDTPHWTEGVDKMEAEIMAFADDVAKKVAARVLSGMPAQVTPAQLWGWTGVNIAQPGKKAVWWAPGHLMSLAKRTADTTDDRLEALAAGQTEMTEQMAANLKAVAALTALVNGLAKK